MRALLLLALAGCYTSSAQPAQQLSNQAHEKDAWVLTERGLGPLTEQSVATADALQHALPGLRVAKTDLGGDSGIVYDVYDRADKLFYVVPDDAEAPDDASSPLPRSYATTMFAIFAMSPRVAVEGRDWRAGAVLATAANVGPCECWGAGEVTACWTAGEHVRLIFEEACDNARDHGASALVGKRIGRIMWKRVPEPPPVPGQVDI